MLRNNYKDIMVKFMTGRLIAVSVFFALVAVVYWFIKQADKRKENKEHTKEPFLQATVPANVPIENIDEDGPVAPSNDDAGNGPDEDEGIPATVNAIVDPKEDDLVGTDDDDEDGIPVPPPQTFVPVESEAFTM